jgi:hypothetical protein
MMTLVNSPAIQIMLRFLVDKASKAQAQKAISDVAKSSPGIGKTVMGGQDFQTTARTVKQMAADLGMSAEQVAKSWAGMASLGGKTEQQILNDVKAFESLEAAANQTAQAVQNIDKRTEAASKTVKKFGQMGGMGMAGFTLAMTGMSLSRGGQSMLGPMEAYIRTVGEGEATSRRWLTATQRIEQAQIRTGRVMADQVLPALEKVATLAEKAASFAEKHPEAVKLAAGAGIGMIVAGGILGPIGQTMSGIAALKMAGALAGGGAGAAAGGGAAGAATVAGVLGKLTLVLQSLAPAGVIAGGVMAGSAGYNAIAKKQGWSDAGTIVGQGLTLAAYGYGRTGWGGSPERAAEWALAIGKLTGAVDGLGQSSEKSAGALTISQKVAERVQKFQQDRLQAYLEYQRAEADAIRDYNRRRESLVRDFNQRMLADEQDYGRNRARSLRDFTANERQIEQDYYRDRALRARDYGVEIARLEEDHQRKMRELQEDHEARMDDLAADRDALGLDREMRRYEKERREAEENYQVEARRRSEDFARQMADMAAQFAISRAQRMEDFKQRLKDDAEQFEIRRTRERAAHQQELADLQSQYNDERRQRNDAYQRQMEDLKRALQYEYDLKVAFTDAEIAYIKSAIASMGGGQQPALPGRASGGYVWSGIWQMHGRRGVSDEFVMRESTTRLAERLAGGRLTNDRLVGLLLGGGGHGQIVYHDNRRIDGRVTAADRRQMREDNEHQLRDLFS